MNRPGSGRVLFLVLLAMTCARCAQTQQAPPATTPTPPAVEVLAYGGGGVAVTDFGKQAFEKFQESLSAFSPAHEIDDDSGTTIGVGGAVGYRFTPILGLRGGLEYSHLSGIEYENLATATGPGGQIQEVFNRGDLEAERVLINVGPVISFKNVDVWPWYGATHSDVTVLSEDERRLQGTTAGGQSIEYKTSGWSSEVGVTGGVKLAKDSAPT